ncbi:hypothetical protein KXW60_006118 [Aspergillus fumigatus]|nr:hypothetical protein KXW60_006118 [Aspergillus fumigatus]KAH3275236.1 hypothetical protein KXW55_007107 [Aspergillus fumigatus]
MIIARFFNGLSGSAFLSVAGGTVGDLFHRQELAALMMVYTASPFLGPEIGPLVGGFINTYTTRRWTFYVLIIWTASILVLTCVCLLETYHPVLLKRMAVRLRKGTGDDRPMQLLAFEPMCMNLCVFSAILLGILYLFFGAFELVFSHVYGFNLWQIGSSFLGILVGMMSAILTDPLWRRNYARLERKHQDTVGEKNEFMPEWRLPPGQCPEHAIIAIVHWVVPIIGSAVFGAGTVLVYSGVFTFLVDAYPTYAASALAANSFVSSTFAGVFPLFGVQMYNRPGYHWATSLLGFLTLMMAPFPCIFFRYGSRIRKKSRFAASHA